MQATSNDAKRIFTEAIENFSASQWPDFLHDACAGDGELRARVERLLDAHRRSDPLLDRLAGATRDETENDETENIEESIGTLIGPYKLLQRIGEGGFGVVYMAEQTRPVRRKVALKVIKPGMDRREIVVRFEAEQQALALMDHPNIAKVFDVGETQSGRPYLVMELVRGIPVTEYADINHLSTGQRLSLFALICRAVHHAHQKGVIHRDLKPSNVMVTLHDGTPVPKVIDFGVSKAISQPLTEKTLFTRFGQVIGTPQYMSPEQAEMSGLDVDTRSDIYSLGVILYELLTGRTPFTSQEIQDAGFDGMRKMIREKDPLCPSNLVQTLDADTATTVASNRSARPDTLRKNLRGELDWIVMRTLEKDRGRRYDSASALADDVDRYLSDQPVEASPPSILYRTYKAYRRNRIACLAGALIAGSLILATGISLVALRDSWRMTQVAMEQGQVATQQAAKAEAEQERAEGFARQASDQARASQSTLELVVELLAKTGINPKTGSEYTVSEALKLLTESNTRKNGKFNLPPAVAAQLHMGLGNAYRRSGVNRLAAIHFQQAVDITQKRPGEQSLVHAKALRYLGASQGSPESIRAAIEIETKRQSTRDVVTSQTLLGQMLGRSEETQSEAIELLEKACSQFEPQPNVELSEIPHFVIAEVLHKLGRQVDAKRYEAKAVEQAIDCFGGSRTIWHRLGESLRDRKRFRDSNRALLVADSLWPESQSDEPAFHIGLNYRELLDYRQAEYYLQKSLRLATARDDAYRVRSARYHLATTLAEQSKSERAVPLLKTLLNDTQARNHRSLACLITLAVDSPGLSEWLVSYRRRLESEVNEDPLAKILLAKIELADGNIGRVKELLGGSNLSNAGQQWHRFFATGHFDEARDYALNWLEVIPSHNLRQRTWKTVGVARSHYHIGDLKAGEDLLRRAIKKAERMDPIDPFTLYWVKYELALILHAQGRTDEARPLCRDVFKATEESAKNKVTIWNDDYYDRITQWHALCLSGIEYDADQWVQNLQRYLRLDDSEKARGACHSLLADHFGQRRDTQRTIYHYERESLTRPLDFRILPFQYCRDRLVNLYLQTGQIDRGRNHFAKVLDRVDKGLPTKHPHRAFTRMRLAKLYLEQPAKPAKAQELLIESKTILERNSMTPDQVMQQIDELLARTGK